MATDLSRDEIEEIRDVFELFDFWDGRDGEVDAFKTGHMLQCLGFNPTQEIVKANGGTDKMGERGYKLEEFIPSSPPSQRSKTPAPSTTSMKLSRLSTGRDSIHLLC